MIYNFKETEMEDFVDYVREMYVITTDEMQEIGYEEIEDFMGVSEDELSSLGFRHSRIPFLNENGDHVMIMEPLRDNYELASEQKEKFSNFAAMHGLRFVVDDYEFYGYPIESPAVLFVREAKHIVPKKETETITYKCESTGKILYAYTVEGRWPKRWESHYSGGPMKRVISKSLLFTENGEAA